MPLTDTKIRNAKSKNKQYKMFDTGGLFLIVAPAGGKWWRFKYRFNGKEKLWIRVTCKHCQGKGKISY